MLFREEGRVLRALYTTGRTSKHGWTHAHTNALTQGERGRVIHRAGTPFALARRKKKLTDANETKTDRNEVFPFTVAALNDGNLSVSTAREYGAS